MTVIETIALFGATLSSLVGAPATGWTESTYTAPVTTTIKVDVGLPTVANSPNASGNLIVAAATQSVAMKDWVTGSDSGLSGGDPNWRAPFASLKQNYSVGTCGWDREELLPGESVYRFAVLDKEEGTNFFIRQTGNPTSASRVLLKTLNNRARKRYGVVNFD